jgi:hypothetical protein
MPFAGEYREAMGFPREGTEVDGFVVELVRVEHAGIGDGRYEYPTEIVLRGKGGKEGVRRALKPLFATRRTIFSEFGNPYQCSTGRMTVESLGDGRYRVAARGVGVRVRLREELERFFASLATTGRLAPGVTADGSATVVEEYLRRYQAEVGARPWK